MVIDDLRGYLQQMVTARETLWEQHSLRRLGYVYSCVEELVLESGQEMKVGRFSMAQRRWMSRVGERVGFEMKECFRNAQAGLLEADRPDVDYCEGYALPEGLIPVVHAWLRVKGQVWDPTFDLKPGRVVAYVGLQFPREWVLRRLMKMQEYGSLLDDWQLRYPMLKHRVLVNYLEGEHETV